jgi:hypothetical protein
VLLILTSQIFLSFFVLKTHQDLSTLKQKGALAKRKGKSLISLLFVFFFFFFFEFTSPRHLKI